MNIIMNLPVSERWRKQRCISFNCGSVSPEFWWLSIIQCNKVPRTSLIFTAPHLFLILGAPVLPPPLWGAPSISALSFRLPLSYHTEDPPVRLSLVRDRLSTSSPLPSLPIVRPEPLEIFFCLWRAIKVMQLRSCAIAVLFTNSGKV